MCRVVNSDIKSAAKKRKLLDLIYYSAGTVLGAPEYRKTLSKAKEKEMKAEEEKRVQEEKKNEKVQIPIAQTHTSGIISMVDLGLIFGLSIY